MALDGRFGIDDPAESKSRLRALKCLLRHFAQKQGQNGGPRAQVYEERFSPSQTVGPMAGMRKYRPIAEGLANGSIDEGDIRASFR